MAVERHHLADLAGRAARSLNERPDRAVTRIPGRLVVDEDLDVAALGRAADPLRVRVADRQRLLHHHVHVPRGRRLDDGRMIERVGERRDGLRLRAIEHRREVGEEDAVRQRCRSRRTSAAARHRDRRRRRSGRPFGPARRAGSRRRGRAPARRSPAAAAAVPAPAAATRSPKRRPSGPRSRVPSSPLPRFFVLPGVRT